LTRKRHARPAKVRIPEPSEDLALGREVRRATDHAEEIAAPLGLSAWIGLPEEQEGRVARVEYAAPFTMEEMTARPTKRG
jgi:hypothetical protein